ncbi:MAG: peroxiredoxin [Brachybacterium sp.]|nr:peroxiredoxin [Brachybacterium sp.]
MTTSANTPVKLAVGDRAPAFDLPTADGRRITTEDLRGAPALIWFYPGANTPVCTRQAVDLRDHHRVFTDAGYRIVGISPDPLPEIQRFVREQELPYTLASDADHAAGHAYGTWGEKNMYGRVVTGTIRSTFALDADGVITFARYRVGTPKHIAVLREKLGI